MALPTDDRLVHGLAQVERTATRMAAMVGELRDLAHLELGQPVELNVKPTDLVALVRAVAEEQQETASRQTVEMHGGTVLVESREGGGSTFTIRLPPSVGPDAGETR